MFIRLYIYKYNEETRNGYLQIWLGYHKGQGGLIMETIRELKKFSGVKDININKIIRKLKRKKFKIEGRRAREKAVSYTLYPEIRTLHQEVEFFYTTNFGTKIWTGYARRCTTY